MGLIKRNVPEYNLKKVEFYESVTKNIYQKYLAKRSAMQRVIFKKQVDFGIKGLFANAFYFNGFSRNKFKLYIKKIYLRKF